VKLSDKGTVCSISIEDLFTEDYEQVKMADLTSLNAFIDNQMCPCNLIKGVYYSLFCVQLLGADFGILFINCIQFTCWIEK